MGRFVKYTINTLATQTVSTAVNVLIVVFIARFLGASIQGQSSVLFFASTTLAAIGGAGQIYAMAHFAERMPTSSLFSNSMLLTCVLGIATSCLAVIIVLFFRHDVFRDIDTTVLTLFLLSVPLALAISQTTSFLRALYKIASANYISTGFSLAFLALLVLFVFSIEPTLLGVVSAYCLAMLIVTIAAVFVSLHAIDYSLTPPSAVVASKLLRYGFKTHYGNIHKQLLYRADVFVLAYFVEPKQVGFYAAAVSIVGAILRVPDAIGSVLLPKIARLNEHEATTFTPQVARLTLLIVGSATASILILSQQVINVLFGPEYGPAVVAIVLLAPGAIALSLWKILANDLIARGYPHQYSWTVIATFYTLLILCILLIPNLGLAGAAMASSIAYVISAVLILYAYIKCTRVPLLLFVPRISDLIFLARLLRRTVRGQ